jgi:hypothetical protein
MAHDAPGVVALLVRLQAFGVEPVKHPGDFVGLRGLAVGQVPGPLWDELERLRPALLRHLRNEPTPFRQRQRRAGR